MRTACFHRPYAGPSQEKTAMWDSDCGGDGADGGSGSGTGTLDIESEVFAESNVLTKAL